MKYNHSNRNYRNYDSANYIETHGDHLKSSPVEILGANFKVPLYLKCLRLPSSIMIPISINWCKNIKLITNKNISFIIRTNLIYCFRIKSYPARAARKCFIIYDLICLHHIVWHNSIISWHHIIWQNSIILYDIIASCHMTS